MQNIYTKIERQKQLSDLLAGKGRAVEEDIFNTYQNEAARYYQGLIAEATTSKKGEATARSLMAQAGYRELKKETITVTVYGGVRITIPSFYARKVGKKKGPLKRGPNGRGIHLLLAYWGYTNKYSPCYVDQVARCGVGSASYDLAEAELQAQGIVISSKQVDHIVQVVGEEARKLGPAALLAPGETLRGKRVELSIDGGRIRSRQTKTGRPAKDQKGPRFDTPWREPKLLVITELDEHGNKQKGTKPIYEATMSGPEAVFTLLTTLGDTLQLNQAKEIIFVNDGATWIWNLLPRIKEHYPSVPITGILDYFHACEHITETTKAHTKKTEAAQKAWATQLATLLRAGQFQEFVATIRAEAENHTQPQLLNHLKYFETKKDYVHYDQYEAAGQPIGSGIVESAVKRVINGRLKAPGSFWIVDNVNRILQLRCALMAGRWHTLMQNLRAAGPLANSEAST